VNVPSTPGAGGASIALVGLGNIGSQTAALLAGVDAIRRVLLVDPDRYEASNLGRQRIAPADVGRPKVEVQAKELRRLTPYLLVERFAHAIESVPLGVLRGCVILSCVDSRIARQSINRIAFALGTPWIDAALDRDGQVRSRVYWPAGGDCLECSWGERDYELLEQRVPCADSLPRESMPQVKATAAPQELGAVTAGLQVAHLRRVLSGEDTDASERGRQSFYDVSSGRGWVGAYTPNPACRLDHRPRQIVDLARSASQFSLGDALNLLGGEEGPSALSLDGQMFVRRLRCPRCGASRRTARRVLGRIRTRTCRKCGAHMAASAADATDVLTARNVSPKLIDAPLTAFGLVDGDVFTVRSREATSHFHLSALRKEAC
jgi:molybdopterin/thiamine biosynthesis adenylyltransferase